MGVLRRPAAVVVAGSNNRTAVAEPGTAAAEPSTAVGTVVAPPLVVEPLNLPPVASC